MEQELINEEEILDIEDKLYKLIELEPYKSYKVEFNKIPKKINGIYFQYNNGCVLYSIINLGYVNEEDIPSTMKHYKNHTYSQDERTDKNYLIKILSLIDLAQLWINLGGYSPYKDNNSNEININKIRNNVYKILKNYLKDNNNKYLKEAFNISNKHERFMTVIGNLPIKPLLLSECNFINKDNNNKINNLKDAIDQGYIKKNDIIFCLNHFIIFNNIIEENNIKYYIFIDSQTNIYDKIKKEFTINTIIEYNNGIIKSPEDGRLINIIESEDKTIGILKLLFI